MRRSTRTYKNLEKLRQSIETIPGDRRNAADSLLKEIVFLDSTLATLKEQIANNGPIIQTARTVRENPALKAYNTSIQRYSLLFKQIVDNVKFIQRAENG